MIVIEGMDNSGKSTLARAMADYMSLAVQESEGPPRSPKEINERVDKYARMGDTHLFVRHPCISDPIYASGREGGQTWITPDRIRLFYNFKAILIYCDAGDRGFDGHEVKDHDTPEHMAMILEKRHQLLQLYRLWAAEHAHFVYRIGDDMERLSTIVQFFKQY